MAGQTIKIGLDSSDVDALIEKLERATELSARLGELSQGANPPFLGAAANRGLFPAPTTRDEAILRALVSSNGAGAYPALVGALGW